MKEKIVYEPPRVEVLEVAVESGFVDSNSNTESWTPGDSI